MTFFLLISIPFSYAGYSWTSTTSYVIKRIVDSDKVYSPENGGVYKILYNEKFERFSRNMSYAQVVNMNGFLQVNRDTERGYEGQCVSLVKALANFTTSTRYWKPRKQVGVDNVAVGKVIAVFNSSGTYAGHVGIYLGKDDEGIWIFDQNWSDKIVTIHKIKFKTKPNYGKGKGDGDRNNAYSYFSFKWVKWLSIKFEVSNLFEKNLLLAFFLI